MIIFYSLFTFNILKSITSTATYRLLSLNFLRVNLLHISSLMRRYVKKSSKQIKAITFKPY